MADINKTVQVIFSADNQLNDELKNINDHIGTVDASFGGLGGRAKNLAEDLLLVVTAVAATATAFATFAAKEAAEFETGIANINTILGETQEKQLPAIRQGILDLSQILPQSAQDLSKAFYDIQSGIPLGEEGLQLLETAAKAATAGITSVQTAVSPFITILNSYKMGAEDAGHVSDILFQTVNHGVINFEQLASGIGTVASIAAGLDQPLEEVGAAMIILTKNTGQQEESFTRLTNTYNQLAQLDTAEKLKAFGVEVYDVTGKMNPLSDIIGQMAEKQMSYQDILKVFPEIRASMGVNILVQDYGNLKNELDAVKNSQGATQAAFDTMMATTENQVKLLKNAWDSFLISAGDPILEALSPVIKELQEALSGADGAALGSEVGKAIGNWITAMDDFMNKLQEIYGEIKGVGDASMIVDFASWAGDIETIKSALTLANTLIQGLAMGVALVHDGFAATGNILNGLKNMVNAALLEPLYLVNQAIIKILEGLNFIPGLDLAGPIELMKQGTEEMGNIIADAFNDTAPFEYWSDNVAKSIAIVDEGINRIGESGGRIGDKIKDGSDQAVDALNPLALALNSCSDNVYDFNAAAEKGADGIAELNGVMVDGVAVFSDGSWSLENAKKAINGTTDAIKKAETATTSKAEADKKASKELEKQIDQVVKFKLGLEEIQSKERVSIFEIQAKVDMAAMEQATKQFEAMFSSIGDGMTSTENMLGGLFDAMKGVDTSTNSGQFKMWDIEKAIEKEQERRDQEFELQKELIETQIDLMNLKKDALQKGDALIHIQGDGLEPELEGFMWQILKRIQIRANAEGAEYLLGI